MSTDSRESLSVACLRLALMFLFALLLAVWPLLVLVAYELRIPST